MDNDKRRISELENSERTLKSENMRLQGKVRDLEHETSQQQSEIDQLKSKLRHLSL